MKLKETKPHVLKLVFLFCLSLQVIFIVIWNLLYTSDGSFRFFTDTLSNQRNQFSFDPINYFTNRIWIDNYRQAILLIADLASANFHTLLKVNSFLQILGLLFLYFGLYKVSSRRLGPNSTFLLFLPLLILFPVVSMYLDAGIVWAYPIYALHFVNLFDTRNNKRSWVFFGLTSFLLSGLHEFTMLYFFGYLASGILLSLKRRLPWSVLLIKTGVTSLAFLISLINFVSHAGQYSTLSQIKSLGILNPGNLQYSLYSLSFLFFLILFYFSLVKPKSIVVPLIFTIALISLFGSYYLTSNLESSNYWVGYLIRNDFTLFFTFSFFLVLVNIIRNPLNRDPSKVIGMIVVACQILGVLFLANYGRSYQECWTSSNEYVSRNGFSTVEQVSKFGECHVDWVSPMTSLIMNPATEPQYLVINKSSFPGAAVTQEGKTYADIKRNAVILPYDQTILDGFLNLNLATLIANLRIFATTK